MSLQNIPDISGFGVDASCQNVMILPSIFPPRFVENSLKEVKSYCQKLSEQVRDDLELGWLSASEVESNWMGKKDVVLKVKGLNNQIIRLALGPHPRVYSPVNQTH